MGPIVTYHIDLAQVALVVFLGGFALLVLYLRREDKREGYPLDPVVPGKEKLVGFPLPPPVKLFRLLEGGTSTNPKLQEQPDALKPQFPFPGSALLPTGDPLLDGIGPASYARRKQSPLRTREGDPQVQPLRLLPAWSVLKGDPDPRGMVVLSAEGLAVGQVVDLWLDHGVKILRYLEVELAGGGRTIMLPIYYADVRKRRREILVRCLTAGRFATVPALTKPDEITAREEDQVNAYYAGGAMYSTAIGVEPGL